MRWITVCGWWLLLFSAVSAAQDAPQAVPAEPPKAKLSDAAWLAGVWKNLPGDRTTFEEHWTAPAAGGMVGMFRMLTGERVIVYEFQLIEETPEGVYLRLRHYQPGMVDRDKEPLKCQLVEATKSRLIFENPHSDTARRVAYVRDDQNVLTVTVDTSRDGKPVQFALKFRQ